MTLILLLLALALPAHAQAPRVEGSVRRPDGSPVAGLEVVLHRYERTAEAETRPDTTGPDGDYGFDVTPDEATGWRVTADFEGATFGTDLLLQPGRADLTVAPPTSDDAAVSVVQDSMALVGDADAVQVLQVLRLRNDAATAYVGGLRLPLLADHTGLEPRSGLDRTRISVVEGDLVTTSPLLPGDTEIQYLYVAKTPERIDRRLRYPSDTVTLLLSGKLRARTNLRDAGTVNLSGIAYRSYRSRGPLREGARITASVSEPREAPKALLYAVPAALALAVIAFPILRRRRA